VRIWGAIGLFSTTGSCPKIAEPGNGARDRQKIGSNFNYYILAGGEDPKEWCIK